MNNTAQQTLSIAGSTDEIDKMLACVKGLPARGHLDGDAEAGIGWVGRGHTSVSLRLTRDQGEGRRIGCAAMSPGMPSQAKARRRFDCLKVKR